MTVISGGVFKQFALTRSTKDLNMDALQATLQAKTLEQLGELEELVKR